MAKKRKPLSQKIRFEVFKRDMFTCQYCGGKAPDTILEVDHIVPVAKNGDNSLENLVTACKECNRGKRDKKLDDVSEVEKSRRQIEEMQERNNMIEMIFKWKESVRESRDNEVGKLNTIFSNYTGFEFNDEFTGEIRRSIKRFGLENVVESLYTSLDAYFQKTDDDMKNWKAAKKVLQKWFGIAYNNHLKKQDPNRYSLNQIKTVAQKEFYLPDKHFYTCFPINLYDYARDEKAMLNLAVSAYSKADFFDKVDAYFAGS